MTAEKLLRRIRIMLVLFIVALALSGITAFPVYTELKWLVAQPVFQTESFLSQWLNKVWRGVEDTYHKYPFLFYGYDWLAFAHLVIAMAFIGPYRDPVRNIWIIHWAMLACIAIIPLAFIAGPIRGVPLYHILIDCSFGVLGIIPLWIVRKWIKQLEMLQKH